MAYGATHSRQTTTRIPAGTPAGSPAPGTAAPQAPDAVTPAELAALADTRSKALADCDEDAFLAALDPATPGLVDEQRRLFRNLRPIPFDEAAYRVAATRPGPAPGDPLTVDVSFDHRITHADTSTVGEGYRWTVTRPAPGAAPRITSITGTPYEGGAGYRYARDYPAPWDRAQLTVARRPTSSSSPNKPSPTAPNPSPTLPNEAAAADLAAYAGPAATAPGFVVVPVADRAAFYELYGGRADQHGDESGLTYALRSSPTGNTAATARPGTTAQFGGARIVLDVTSGFTSPAATPPAPATSSAMKWPTPSSPHCAATSPDRTNPSGSSKASPTGWPSAPTATACPRNSAKPAPSCAPDASPVPSPPTPTSTKPTPSATPRPTNSPTWRCCASKRPAAPRPSSASPQPSTPTPPPRPSTAHSATPPASTAPPSKPTGRNT
ncbi:hypothetical protein ACU686_01710 [Yinghuangia aomiensis]